jgi:uncharacterized membrane protein
MRHSVLSGRGKSRIGEMTAIAVQRGGRHFPLLIGAGSALASAAVLGVAAPSIAADPLNGTGAVMATLIVTPIDLFLAGILGWAAFRANRGGVLGVSLIAVVAALLIGLAVLDGAFAFSSPTYAGASSTSLLFFISAAANALVVLSAVLELTRGRQHQ